MSKCFKILVLAMSIILVFSFIGCKAKQTSNKLLVGTSAEYPPFESKNGEEFVGFDMDIAREIAQKLGMELEIVDMEFDTLIPSLTSKKIDFAIAAMTINPEREAMVKFSDPYYQTNQAILVKKDSKITIKSPEDLAKYRIGAQNGTTGQIWVDDNLIKTNKMKADKFKKYATNIEAVTDLINGNLDLVIIDDAAAKGYEKAKDVKSIFVIETNESYGIAFAKDSDKYEKVNNALRELMASPKWQELIDKHIVGSINDVPNDTSKTAKTK